MDTRRAAALADWIVYRGEWSRPDGPYRSAWQAPICGPFGQVLERAVQAHMEGGRGREILDLSTGQRTGEGYPLRWERMLQMLQPGWNLSQLVADRCSPLYREPTVIGGLEGQAWLALRAASGLDTALLQKQHMAAALGSAGVGITLDGLPGVRVYAPHEITLIPVGWNPRVVGVAVYHTPGGHVIASDVRDWRQPVWGEWSSMAAMLQGSRPIWSLQGADYPFVWLGRPLPHIIGYVGKADADCLQPSGQSLRQATIDTILEMGWARLVARVGSFNRVVLASEGTREPEGMAALSLDPTAVSAVWGAKAPQIQVVQNSVDAAARLWEIVTRDVQSRLAHIDGDLRLRQADGGVQSGRAIELEREGVQQYARAQAQLQSGPDGQLVSLLAASWNWMARQRLVDPGLLGLTGWETIPEDTPTLEYPLVLSQSERRAVAAAMEPSDPVGAWMIVHGTQDRAAAMAAMLDATRQRTELAQAGYGVAHSDLWRAQSEPDEGPGVVYVPSSEVADTAARGLRLQADWRSRWGGLPAAALLARGRRLQAQDAMTLGEVRALSSWLEAHGESDAGPGVWGDDADPSGAWVAYLTQGGDAGRVWAQGILAPSGSR